MALEASSTQFSPETELNRCDDALSSGPAQGQENYVEIGKEKRVVDVTKVRKSSKSDSDTQGYTYLLSCSTLCIP